MCSLGLHHSYFVPVGGTKTKKGDAPDSLCQTLSGGLGYLYLSAYVIYLFGSTVG